VFAARKERTLVTVKMKNPRLEHKIYFKTMPINKNGKRIKSPCHF